ncbi:MAG: CotH kinase family protein [Ignavibacterium sp.]|nr:CotH kinase family protein [Ignavibacterium sp.]
MKNFIYALTILITVNGFSQNKNSQTDNINVDFTSSNLPIVVINTNGQIIPDDYKITADMGIIYNGEGVRNYITDPFNHYNGKIGIELRGSSSQQFPKKQYGVETRDSLGNDLSVSLLGFPAETDWVFFAPYNDKSLIRDALSYRLSREMNRYASRSKFFELVLNGEYMGVYVLFEKIKRDANRVNIKKLNPADTTGDAVTGGYILKIDKLDGEGNDGWYSNFLPFPQSNKQIFWQYHYPKPEDIVPLQKNYIKSFIYAFESAMHGPYFADTVLGYPKYIDANSFVDFILLNELVKNIDSYRLSTFFYKDRDSRNPKMFAGPVWDFNLAFGNADYYEAYMTSGWVLEYVSDFSHMPDWENFYIPFWWKKLFDESRFRNIIYNRWQELRSTVWTNQNIMNLIDSLVLHLEEARERNFQRWPVIGQWIWPNYFVGQTYQEEIDYLKNWLVARLNWLDQNMVGGPSAVDEEFSPLEFVLEQNYPNPFNPVTTIRYSIPSVTLSQSKDDGSDSNLLQYQSERMVSLVVYDVLGREVATLVNEEQRPGIYEIQFDADNHSSGIYFYKLTSGNYSDIKKMILLR